MVRLVLRSKGFSLIEMMIAMVIIMISMLALLTSLTTSMQQNVANEKRNTAIRLTNVTAETLAAVPYTDKIVDSLLSEGTHTVIDSDARKKGMPETTQTVRGARVVYNLSWQVAPKMTNVKEITINVTYDNKGKQYSNQAVIYRSMVSQE